MAIFNRLAVIVSKKKNDFQKNRLMRPSDHWLSCYQGILDLIRDIPNQWHGEVVTLHRYSARQQKEFGMVGVFGSLHLAVTPLIGEELSLLFQVADLFHLGKGTIMGLGRLLPSSLDNNCNIV